MLLLDWYKQWLDLRIEHKEKQLMLNKEIEKPCDSCETLKEQLSIANHEREKLLARIMEKPEPIPNVPLAPVTMPRMVPWNVRRQMLEAEDRARAKAIKEAAKADTPEINKKSVEELEKEMDNAATERERSAESSN
jgi:hypothetical protein